MPVLNARRSALLFWSAMDAFYICFVLFSSLRRGAIPLWTDLDDALTNMRNWGGGLEVMIWLGLAIQLSVVVSCVLFYRGAGQLSTLQPCKFHFERYLLFRPYPFC